MIHLINLPRGAGTGDEPPKAISPWGLNPREAKIMDAMLVHGCHKGVSRVLFIEPKTIEKHLTRVAKKMPEHRHPLLRYLAWDRWRREGVRT